jgi:hypothetical protein
VKSVVLNSFALILLTEIPASTQLSTPGEIPYHNPAAIQDPTDCGVRNQNSKMGRTIEDWARHINDADPASRLEAVRLLAESGKPEANEFLIRAVYSRNVCGRFSREAGRPRSVRGVSRETLYRGHGHYAATHSCGAWKNPGSRIREAAPRFRTGRAESRSSSDRDSGARRDRRRFSAQRSTEAKRVRDRPSPEDPHAGGRGEDDGAEGFHSSW